MAHVAADAVLHVCSHVVATMVAHGRRGMPNEVAGLLGADESGVIVAAVALGDGSPDGVRVGADDIAAATAVLTEHGHRTAGSYHSHPRRPPAPTEADRLAMRTGEPMLILAPVKGELRAFRLAVDRVGVEEIAVREVDAPLV